MERARVVLPTPGISSRSRCPPDSRHIRERKGVYGLGGLWRIVWCMEIGAIGVVKV